MNFLRYYHTLKYLKAEQICFQVHYKVGAKLRRLIGRKSRYVSYKAGNRIVFLPFPNKTNSYKGNRDFEFLNLSHRFCGAWDDSSMGDLWRYNLNYMDFILQPVMSVKVGMEWMESLLHRRLIMELLTTHIQYHCAASIG